MALVVEDICKEGGGDMAPIGSPLPSDPFPSERSERSFSFFFGQRFERFGKRYVSIGLPLCRLPLVAATDTRERGREE